MASEVKTNKISPATGTDVTLGDASDTFTLPSGSAITVASGGDINVASGGEIDIASGATLDVNGTIDVTGATVTGLTTGMVLQVIGTSSNSTISTSNTSYTATGLSIAITPASTSSRFILTLAGGTTYSDYAAGEVWTTFYVDTGSGAAEVSDTGPYSMIQENDRYHITMIPNNFFTNSAMMIHSPSTTNETTYTVYFKANANGAYFNLASSRVVFTVMELSS